MTPTLNVTLLYETNLKSFPLVHRGKVRDIYAIDEQNLLIVTTDRVSAFDVILPTPVPEKGRVLTEMANFWFSFFSGTIPNQLSETSLDDLVMEDDERELIRGRAMVVRKLKALPIEAIVRGYLIGSGWKDYQKTGAVCGIKLPDGLQMAQKLPEPIYTPSSKAAVGEHDENIDFNATAQLVGEDIAEQVKQASLEIYQRAAAHALERGIIIADTKFEFGLDDSGRLVLIDEVLTPDSSRFWEASTYSTGISPPSFDKQFVRDYLETLDWNKTAPGPELPEEIIQQTAARYQEALTRLTQ